MRRIIILGLLFLLMYALQFLQVETEAPFHPKSLATLGFVLLAAYTLGEVTSSFGLPKITGYIVTGIVFGPYVVNLFSVGVVDDLKGVNSLAIGLIALTAGGELKLSGLRRVAKSLTFIVLIKGFLILLAVGLTVFAIRPLIPFLADATAPLVLAVGAIFGILAIGTSPSATIAVINETGAAGRLTDTTLGAAVVKDVVMVVLLAVAISLAKLFSTPGMVFESTVFLHVGKELLFSIIAGAVLGATIIAYIRFIHAEMWLFIVGVIFFATAVAELFHLEALLMFITAGFMVQNFSKFGDSLIHPIEDVSLPVYVVFFSIAGAGLELGALRQVGVVALILVVVRIVAIYFGTRFATTLANEPPAIKKNAWLSFIAQAGVVLGLSIIVENNLPGLGAEIKTVVLGTIALNLILGPITFKIALANAGETKEKREAAAVVPAAETPAAVAGEPVPAVQLPLEVRYPVPDFLSPQLNEAAGRLREQLIKLQNEFVETFIKPQTGELQSFVAQMRNLYGHAVERLAAEVVRIFDATPRPLIHIVRESRIAFSRRLMGEITSFAANDERTVAAQNAFKELFAAVAAICEQSEAGIEVTQEPERFQALPGDSLFVQARKMLKRWRKKIVGMFGSGAAMTRFVSLRRLAKYHFAGGLPMPMLKAANWVGAQPLFALKKCAILYRLIDEGYETLITFLEENGENPPAKTALNRMRASLDEEFKQALADVEQYGHDCQKGLGLIWAQTYGTFLRDLRLAGTFELPRRRYRYSRIYEQSEKAKSSIAAALAVWSKYNKGFAGNHAKQAEIVILEDNVSRIVDATIFQTAGRLFEKLQAGVLAAKEKCEAGRQNLEQAFDAGAHMARLREAIVAQQEEIVAFIQNDSLKKLNALRASRELNALMDVMLQKFSELADEMPREYFIVDEDDVPAREEEGMTPPDFKLEMVPMQEIVRSYLESEIARDLGDVNRLMLEEVDETIQMTTDVYKIIKYNLTAATEALQTAEPPNEISRPKELALGSLQRALARLETAVEKIESLEQNVNERISTQVDENLQKIDEVILRESTLMARARLRQKEAAALGSWYLEQAWKWLSTNYRLIARRLEHRYRPFAEVAIKDIRTTLGLQQLTPAEILAIHDQAKLDQSVIAQLPFIYQKLFDITPLQTGDFLIARGEEIELVKTAKQRWQQGMHCAIAVVGELGSGKTSFINVCVKEILQDCRVYSKTFPHVVASEEALAKELAALLRIPPARNWDELETALAQTPERFAVVLEDAHKLFLRTLGGFQALRRLLLLVANTSDRVLWIFSMRAFAWRYLNKVLNLADCFTFVINMENVSRDEMERVILSRHKVSGFDLRFLPDEVMKHRRKYRNASEGEKQQILGKEYFDQLSKATEGNILAAMFYWLKSLGEVRDGELAVKPLRRLAFDFLHDLQVEKLLTLAMVIQHGSLAVGEHAQIFGQDLHASQATLTYLANINLLIKEIDESDEGRFAVSRVIYKPLANELRDLNILH
ncbi:cation:proton antiporter [candidate division KSB1 bacterium]|nr:cation:proton antiporter [candidate division KSB1 bacterium]